MILWFVCSVVESGLVEIPAEIVLVQRTCQVIVVGCIIGERMVV